MSLSAVTLTLALLAPQSPDSSPTHGAAAPNSGAREIRHIPVREWLAPATYPVQPPLGSFLDTESSGEPMFLLGALEESRAVFEAGQIPELVDNIVALDDGTALDLEGTMLRVSGSPDQVNRVSNAIRDLTRAFVHNVEVRAELYRVPSSGEFPAMLPAGQLTGLVRDRELQNIWSASSTCAAGNLTSLGKDRRTSYVHDVDVEVAQSAQIGDTETSTLFEGIRLAIEPHVLAKSSDLVVFAQFAFGELRQPIQLRAVGNEDIPHLDVPNLDCTSGTMSGRVPNGGTLLLTVRGNRAGGANMLLAVTVSAAGPGGGQVADASVIPVSALLSKALRTPVTSMAEDLEDSDCSLVVSRYVHSLNHGPSQHGTMQELLHEALGLDGNDQEWLEMYGGHAVIKGAAETREAAERVVVGLQDQLLQTVRVDLRTSMDDVHFGNTVFPKAHSAPSNHEGQLHEITFPAMIGRPHVVIRGHETTVVRENNVEIAQKASITDPVVDEVFSGVTLSLFVYPQQTGMGADVEIDVRHAPQFVHRAAQTKDGADLYLPTIGRARFFHGGPMSAGAEHVLGEGPTLALGDRNYRTRQTIQVSRL